jgi:hypothetical protein
MERAPSHAALQCKCSFDRRNEISDLTGGLCLDETRLDLRNRLTAGVLGGPA